MRADILDIVDIFEVNRKECAKLLLEYPRWAVPGTFKPKPGTPGDDPDRIPEPDKDWQLESTIIEVYSAHLLYSTIPVGHILTRVPMRRHIIDDSEHAIYPPGITPQNDILHRPYHRAL